MPPGTPAPTPIGTALDFGASAVLPADPYRATGPTAMYTVTGITRAEGVPEDETQGGTPYFVYVTVTSLAPNPAPAPRMLGFAGSADGKAAVLTTPPRTPTAACPRLAPPMTMRRGESFSACLVAMADPGQRLHRVVYSTDTTGDDNLDYASAPVVWRNPNESAAPSSSASAG
ncbi:hypothetical protein GCM10009624_18590 [Gordonia sinesedis]